MASTKIATLFLALSTLISAGPAQAPPLRPLGRATSPKHCPLPAPGQPFGTATPEEVDLDSDAVAKAVAYANSHNRVSLQIFRHGCLVSTGVLDTVTDTIANNVWSCTKSVVSLLTGIAIHDGKMNLDDPVGKFLPTGPGWGDAAHRAITIHDLLTETAGLREAIFSDAATVVTETSSPQIALAQPIIHDPGSFFEYAQRVPDLLAYAVTQAVGMDLQKFAQQRLFGPIGIPADSYVWLRDRSGNTYGYAWLFLPPTQLAKLGLLAQYFGKWNNQQIVPAEYVKNASTPSVKNPCYGWLFWNNAGQPCTSANIPSAQTFYRPGIPAAPKDMFLMVGALQQNNFLIPSLDMTVTWTGVLGDYAANLGELLSAAPGPLYNNFFSLLIKAVKDQKVVVEDPGFLSADPLDLDITPTNYLDPQVLLSNIDTNPNCNILFCDESVQLKGLLLNLGALFKLVVGSLQDIAIRL